MPATQPKLPLLLIPILIGVLLPASLTAEEAVDPAKLDDPEDQIIFTMGHSLAQNLRSYNLDEREWKILYAGMEAGVRDDDMPWDRDELGRQTAEMKQRRLMAAATEERKYAEEFLAAAAKEPGARVSDSGLVYREIEAGTGESPERLDTVTVQYTGTLRDGTVFDSSAKRGKPFVTPLTRVIRCWTEGVQMMKVGGKAVLYCPSKLAYGVATHGKIPSGSALRFEVELLAVDK